MTFEDPQPQDEAGWEFWGIALVTLVVVVGAAALLLKGLTWLFTWVMQ